MAGGAAPCGRRTEKVMWRGIAATIAVWALFPLTVRAQGGALAGLVAPRDTRIVHYASTDKSGGNADFVPVAPGQTVTLMDHRGAGTVRRWWVTIAPFGDVRIHRQAIVRCYWDDEETPSVEVPVGDFFGGGFGEYHPYISLPLNMTSGGYNCYWAMPFARHARITIENRSKVRIDALYYNIDVEASPAPPKVPPLYFHAQFRRQKPTELGKPVTLVEATGRGHYVGTLLSMQMLRGRSLGFLEGDEQVYVDGEAKPSIQGTGTEDYFCSGWYFSFGTYAAPYHGLTIKDDAKSRISAYRWHIEDPIPFTKSLRFTIEHGGGNDVRADYSSVAFWYQTHPRAPFPPLPADLLPTDPATMPRIPGIIEGESLVGGATATEGDVEPQDMSVWEGDWSGLSQLWWRPTRPGGRLTLHLTAPAARTYELVGYFTQAPDYGDVRVSVNGQPLPTVARGYNAAVVPSGLISLGKVALKAGANEVVLEIVGKDARSHGYLVGLDGFVLR
jgi:hypothetical protein